MNPPRLARQQRDLQQQAGAAFDAAQGPSFPIATRLLSTLLVVGLATMGAVTWFGAAQSEVLQEGLGAAQVGFLLAVLAVVGSGYWGILTSRTRIDGEQIEQSWLWRKKVRIAEITQLKLISVPGLDWLIVPRLVVRTGYGLTTFHTGDPAVLARFRMLAHGE